MMLTTRGRYAVMAMVDLANQAIDTPIKLAEISSRQEINLDYLEQIFSSLKGAGIVRSVRGPGGGYLFSKNLGEITIADIIHAVEEGTKITRCRSEEYGCVKSGVKCITHDLWSGLEEAIDNYFASIVLSSLRRSVS